MTRGRSCSSRCRRTRADLKSVDYDKDVKPWLGDRFGVAVLPSDQAGDVNVAVALQVKDEDKARAGINKLMAASGGTAQDPDVAFRDGYALLTEKGKGAGLSPPSTRARWPRTRRMSRT